MANYDYEIVNGRKIRVRPKETVSEIDKNGYFRRQPNHFTTPFGDGENDLKADVIYACGPTPMLRALKAYSQEKGILCYLSLEEKMACGIGACLACTCQTKDVDEHSQVHNKRICKDGPVFLAEDIEL